MSTAIRRFRLVTFDVTNTLIAHRTSPGKQYGEIGALFGVRCDNNDLAKNFRINWYKMNQDYPNFGRNSSISSWQDWWHQLIATTFAESGAQIPAEKMESFAGHLIQLYKTSICWQHCNGSIDLLTDLQKSCITLGVIANFDPRLDKLLRNMRINQFFTFALNSYDCRVEKPKAEIFELAFNASKIQDLKPAECLHIGDGPTTDYLAAKALGWNAALVHEKSVRELQEKYGEDKIDERFVFPSLYDFHKKWTDETISW